MNLVNFILRCSGMTNFSLRIKSPLPFGVPADTQNVTIQSCHQNNGYAHSTDTVASPIFCFKYALFQRSADARHDCVALRITH